MLLGEREESQTLRQKQILKRKGNDFLQSRRERIARGVTLRLREVPASCKKNQKTVNRLTGDRAVKHENHKFK